MYEKSFCWLRDKSKSNAWLQPSTYAMANSSSVISLSFFIIARIIDS